MLATYGVDGKGRPFVHVKIYKQNRIYGELVIHGGSVRIHCRNCLRWHTVVFRETKAELQEDSSFHLEQSGSVASVLDPPAPT